MKAGLLLVLGLMALTLARPGLAQVPPPAVPTGHPVSNVLILASYHDGDEWTDSLVSNLTYYLRGKVNRVRVHYLDARDLPRARYLKNFALYSNGNRLAPYDRVILLDDPALRFYREYASWFPDRHPIAIGVNDPGLAEVAAREGVVLADTHSAVIDTVQLAREISGRNRLLLVHSATRAGLRLRHQIMPRVEAMGFASVAARTWRSLYDDDVDASEYAIVALDAPLQLATHHAVDSLASHFRRQLGDVFCALDYLTPFGCVGGSFINVASLSQQVARRVSREADASTPLMVPQQLSLEPQLLDRLPEGVDVKVLGGTPGLLSRWAGWLIGGLSLLLITGAPGAWVHLRIKQRQIRRVRRESTYDALTNLYNRQAMLAALDERIRDDEPFTAIYIDLNGFKEINDAFGHAQGDTLLRLFAARLRESAGRQPAVGRMGGDEFLILCGPETPCHELAELLLRALKRPFEVGGNEYTLGCSMGLAHYPLHARSAAQLLKCADAAMYAAKEDREDSLVEFTSAMLDAQTYHAELSNLLEQALAAGGAGLSLAIQPIHSLERRGWCAGEVLLRWEHAERGPISPGVFIPIAEASDLIIKLGDWALETVLARLADEPALAQLDYLSLNLSPKQLYTRRFVDTALALTARHGIDPGRISFELTEHVKLLDRSTLTAEITRLRRAGFRVALDDFGTGYTSISFLKEIPFSSIKIDRSLIAGLSDRDAQEARGIMDGLLYLVKRLGRGVVIEGVETAEEVEILRAMGADLLQGYYFQRPLAWRDFFAALPARAGRPAASS
ncbi:bifunctional diguanylate cyclase/phosphodiesterase [Modicisalibacter tunisiensis]|uniref:putative bifunctional diguanylate cyclase/phosphodiesterase n=1 Tax=Modicisalibacter tunisiensis TaxID=390637 RepID=UPI001CCA73EC|nr:bifunctional diguanylate cyclase/phosphodiesterase [Modicisalibacter tunisiensis]MBZ9540335.1 bifunctional diguanylate cyclase/phosphodiesterase [Modicisalibacter tunisiensis]